MNCSVLSAACLIYSLTLVKPTIMQPKPTFHQTFTREFPDEQSALNFNEALSTLHPDQNSPLGGIGGRIMPFFFIAGGMWIIVYIVLWSAGKP